MTSIQPRDLQLALAQHRGSAFFARALESSTTPKQLLWMLAQYIQFSSPFGGGVAHLTGEIAVRQDLFRDPTEQLEMIADRSVEVAGRIFFAAIDEFDDRSTPEIDTHRTLAQATLKTTGQFFGFDSDMMKKITRPRAATKLVVKNVSRGYGIGQAMNARKLFFSIGFHMGSEILADQEFRLLDTYLRKKQPDLVKHLLGTSVKINKTWHVAYFWVRIHTSVETEHFAAAARAANLALQYYAGKKQWEHIKKWILEGFAQFAKIQERFMRGLAREGERKKII